MHYPVERLSRFEYRLNPHWHTIFSSVLLLFTDRFLKPVSPGIYVPTAALDGQLLNIWRPLHADENLQTGKIRGYEALSL
ncbi:hypothetical protein [Paraburkholderia caribensis]|uniref:hypothetical protein n=1 Tax=Paraburkholderia caribensis TaxID=75105 RepID=UPI001428BF1E|nr:hypothetical protein [Paraburkholderia caribensis]